jgi:hypothetical protein
VVIAFDNPSMPRIPTAPNLLVEGRTDTSRIHARITASGAQTGNTVAG